MVVSSLSESEDLGSNPSPAAKLSTPSDRVASKSPIFPAKVLFQKGRVRTAFYPQNISFKSNFCEPEIASLYQLLFDYLGSF